MSPVHAEQVDAATPLQYGGWSTYESLETCRALLNHKAFLIRHGLAQNPLFTADALIETAGRASKRSRDLYFEADKLAVSKAGGGAASPAEVIHRIETAGAWMRMTHVEVEPRYKPVLDEFVAFLAAMVEPDDWRRLNSPELNIFITSPNKTTRCHFDREVNFLCQVQGTKEVWVSDPCATTDPELERHYTFGQVMGNSTPQAEAYARKFVLKPGEGVHIPPHAKHWVYTFDEYSVSAAFNLELPAWYQDSYRANYCLRRLGFTPHSPDWHRRMSPAKAMTGFVVRRARQAAAGAYRSAKRLVRR